MEYFNKFLRPAAQSAPKPQIDREQEFHRAWDSVRDTLTMPDERQLTKGIKSTKVPEWLASMVNALLVESTSTDEGGTGACMEYLLKNDVLGTLVRLSESDRPAGIQAETLHTISQMVIVLNEHFLVHSAVHKAVLRLLRNCVGDDLQEQLDGRGRPMGAAGNVVQSQPSEHEAELVEFLSVLCNRISSYRSLLMIFFHDKHWYRSEPLFSVEEEDEEEEEEEDTAYEATNNWENRATTPSPTPTITSNQPVAQKKTEYEFLLFNYLLRFVHREGHVGDHARGGFVVLMDVAMQSRPALSGEEKGESDAANEAALALAEYILDGDCSDVLGAGLSAVYSVLPFKLAFLPQPPSETGDGMKLGAASVATEDDLLALQEKNLSLGVEDARNTEFTTKIDHFLTLLLFLQSVLTRNQTDTENVNPTTLVGTAIIQSILDAIRRIFLENVLYPSILECSDADGSSVAVMSYIEIVIRTLRDGPLAKLFVEFLVSEDNDDSRPKQQRPQGMVNLGSSGPSSKATEERRTKHRRRQSTAMTLLEMEAPESRKVTDYFTSMGRFTLKDLLLTNLRSKSQASATSALQLLQTLLTYHPQITVERILLVIPDSRATSFPHPALLAPSISSTSPGGQRGEEADDEDSFLYPGAEDPLELLDSIDKSVFIQPETTYSTHERETALYLSLVSRVDPDHGTDNDDFSTGYDHYLHDALLSIQSQSVYWKALEGSGGNEEQLRFKHRLNVNDPILSSALESLRSFFFNTPDFNIGLTGLLAALAIHPDRSLAGWLTFAINDDEEHPTGIHFDKTLDSDGDDRSIDFTIEEKLSQDHISLPAASMDENSRPVVYTIFHSLVALLERYRRSVENFDKYLVERRRGLLFSENLTDALSIALDLREDVKVVPDPVSPVKPKNAQSTSSSFISFLTPRKSKPVKNTAPEPVTPPRRNDSTSVATSPFVSHYERTGTVKVEPFVAPVPSSGLWTPPSKSSRWNIPDDDVFGSGWTDKQPSDNYEKLEEVVEKPPPVTLSHLLDNVVILEESIKELVSIIHARRSLGIDSLRYL